MQDYTEQVFMSCLRIKASCRCQQNLIGPNQTSLRACLYGGGGPQVGGVTHLFIQSLILI